MSNHTIQGLKRRPGDVEVATADIVDGFVVNKEGTVAVLNGGVGREHRIVGFHDGGGNARSGVDSELELGFLAIIGGQTLQQQGAEPGPSSTTKGVEDQETLEGGTVILYSLAFATPSRT